MRLRHLLIFGWIFTGIISLLLFLFIVTSDDEESNGAQFDYSGFIVAQLSRQKSKIFIMN